MREMLKIEWQGGKGYRGRMQGQGGKDVESCKGGQSEKGGRGG